VIKVNLLPHRKTKRASSSAPTRDLWIGGGGLALAAAGVFLVLHRPMSTQIDALATTNEELAADNAAKQRDLKDFPNLKASAVALRERTAAIEKLVQAKAVPAHLMQELGNILTPGGAITMSKEMETLVGTNGDPNKRFLPDWDPKHVWITKFTEKDGTFQLTGGAQSDPDVIQLAKRMQASLYFYDVSPQGGQRMADKESNISYFEFSITGKVVY